MTAPTKHDFILTKEQVTGENFLAFCYSKMESDHCNGIEKGTSGQSAQYLSF